MLRSYYKGHAFMWSLYRPDVSLILESYIIQWPWAIQIKNQFDSDKSVSTAPSEQLLWSVRFVCIIKILTTKGFS